jgi:sigma-B regulation protein RsbU (phosphoserine phosphatase)
MTSAQTAQPLAGDGIFDSQSGDWRERLDKIVDLMRDMSRQTDPQEMVRVYGRRMLEFMPRNQMVSLSRRDLPAPKYRITRSSLWKKTVNPWAERDQLPVMEGGLLGELIYGDEPRLIDDFAVDPDDPAAEYLAGQRSLFAIPLYDKGTALNMVVLMRDQPASFNPETVPQIVWISNLFGRATQNLVLSDQLRQAYESVDHELRVVANIQRSLLPRTLPKIETMELAAFYQTSRRAGGDYYDFFPLPDGRWGILIADVSGHGTPAAVIMAVLHGIAHTFPGAPTPPSRMLSYVNEHLTQRYTGDSSTFVTAFYGIYDPRKRELVYASAGHNPPRVKRCSGGEVISLDSAQGVPLGIARDEQFSEHVQPLRPGDQIIFYTDGITEAMNETGEQFGVDRLDAAVGGCPKEAGELIESIRHSLADFGETQPPGDDQTLLVARIS